jgi:hypothetical protein
VVMIGRKRVKEKGWEGFAGHLAKAREHLVAAYRLDPSRPEAAAEMIPVTMGQNSEGESEEVWFERAVKAQVDFAPAYVSMSWALRPRWGGSTEAMYKLADRCASSDRFDTSVPYQCVLTFATSSTISETFVPC